MVKFVTFMGYKVPSRMIGCILWSTPVIYLKSMQNLVMRGMYGMQNIWVILESSSQKGVGQLQSG